MYAGPLFAVGLALFSTGIYRACTGARLFDTRENWSHVALGTVMCAAAMAMIAKDVG
jgi:hypothetical protein